MIGAGAVGTAIAEALYAKDYKIRAVVSKGGRTSKLLAKKVGASSAHDRDALSLLDAEGVIFLAVPDDEIKNVVDALAHRTGNFSRAIVYHCSGALPSDVLSVLRKKGAAVGSFHPLQTFPRRGSGPGVFDHIWIGLEGDKKAIAIARKIAKEIGAHSLVLTARQKIFYHIGAVFSSNYFVTLLSAVETLGTLSGLTQRKAMAVYEPLILQSYRNVKTHSAAEALTGPIARGDRRTVARHRAALRAKGLTSIADLYNALAKHTSLLAKRKGT